MVASNGKLALMQKNLRADSLGEAVKNANAGQVTEIDLSMNQLDSAGALQKFINLRSLTLAHNNFTQMRGIPGFSNLEFLDLSYNSIRDMDQTLCHICANVSSVLIYCLIKPYYSIPK